MVVAKFGGSEVDFLNQLALLVIYEAGSGCRKPMPALRLRRQATLVSVLRG